MTAIPGNKHFQGDVEYATMINFYFGPTSHIIGQFLLYGALQSNAIQGIVLSAQALDDFLVSLFKKTCGLSFSKGWICITGGQFEGFMVFTLGLIVIII